MVTRPTAPGHVLFAPMKKVRGAELAAQRSDLFCLHLDGSTGTFGHAHPATLAIVVIELEALAGPEFDHRVVRTDNIAVVAFETVAAGKAAAGFKQGIGLVESALDFIEG